MQIIEQENQWLVKFTDGRINQIHIDFRLTLDITDASGTTPLTIESPCHLNGPKTSTLLTPAQPSSLAPILPYFNANVSSITIQKTGHLNLEFNHRHTLHIYPDNVYEAWQLGCASGPLLVCPPGGEVCFFELPGI